LSQFISIVLNGNEKLRSEFRKTPLASNYGKARAADWYSDCGPAKQKHKIDSRKRNKNWTLEFYKKKVTDIIYTR